MKFILIILVVASTCLPALAKMDYTALRQLIKSGKTSTIQKVEVTLGSDSIGVQLAGTNDIQYVLVPPELRQKLIEDLDQADVPFEVREQDKSTDQLFAMLSSFFLPILLLVGFLFMFRSANAQRRM